VELAKDTVNGDGDDHVEAEGFSFAYYDDAGSRDDPGDGNDHDYGPQCAQDISFDFPIYDDFAWLHEHRADGDSDDV